MALYITSKTLSNFIILKVSTEYYIILQFYVKTSKVISNVFDYISKVIVIVIITFLQVLLL